MTTFLSLVAGLAIGAFIAWLRWRKYWRAMAALDPHTKWMMKYYAHCASSKNRGPIEMGPGFMKDDHEKS